MYVCFIYLLLQHQCPHRQARAGHGCTWALAIIPGSYLVSCFWQAARDPAGNGMSAADEALYNAYSPLHKLDGISGAVQYWTAVAVLQRQQVRMHRAAASSAVAELEVAQLEVRAHRQGSQCHGFAPTYSLSATGKCR